MAMLVHDLKIRCFLTVTTFMRNPNVIVNLYTALGVCVFLIIYWFIQILTTYIIIKNIGLLCFGQIHLFHIRKRNVILELTHTSSTHAVTDITVHFVLETEMLTNTLFYLSCQPLNKLCTATTSFYSNRTF